MTNPKVLKMGVGRVGAAQALKSGGVLTVVLLSAYRVLDFFLRDGATLTELVGSLATDVVKAALSVGVGVAAAIVIPGIATFAIGPLVIAIAFSFGTGLLLGQLDNNYKITEHLIDALDRLSEAAASIAGEISNAAVEALTRERSEAPSGRWVVDLAEEAVAELIASAGRSAKRVVLREISKLTWATPRVGF